MNHIKEVEVHNNGDESWKPEKATVDETVESQDKKEEQEQDEEEKNKNLTSMIEEEAIREAEQRKLTISNNGRQALENQDKIENVEETRNELRAMKVGELKNKNIFVHLFYLSCCYD